MSISSTPNRQAFSGNGTTTVFSIPFAVINSSYLTVLLVNDIPADAGRGNEVAQTLTTDYTLSGTLTEPGSTLTMVVAPAVNYKLVIIGAPALTQTLTIYENSAFPPAPVVSELDLLTRVTQYLKDLATRSVRMRDGATATFDPKLPPNPVAGNVLVINTGADGFEYQDTVAGPPGPTGATGPAGADGTNGTNGQGVPTGGTAGQILSKIDGTDYNTNWVNNSGGTPAVTTGDAYKVLQVNPAETGFELTGPVSYSGISALTGASFSSTGIKDTLDKIIRITYTLPSASLSGTGSGTLRENGDTQTNPTLSVSITEKSDPILDVAFYADSISGPNQIGTTQTSGGGIPSGGTNTQATSLTFSANKTFWSRVRDTGASNGGTPQNRDVSVSYSFVYPYYYGNGASGLTPAQVAMLNKQIISNTGTKAETFSANAGDKLYFAYPASYSSLTSILDVNNFETISDWTLSTSSITGLDGNAVSYKIYAFNNAIGVTGSYQYTFKQ